MGNILRPSSRLRGSVQEKLANGLLRKIGLGHFGQGHPGAMPFTVIPCFAHSAARSFVRR